MSGDEGLSEASSVNGILSDPEDEDKPRLLLMGLKRYVGLSLDFVRPLTMTLQKRQVFHLKCGLSQDGSSRDALPRSDYSYQERGHAVSIESLFVA